MLNPFVSLPYRDESGIKGKYLYAVGGYHSTDTGCPAWGTSDPSDIRFIGDHLGDLVITYADGTADTVPLILGYTLWLHSTWMETPAPFMGEGKDDALAARLMETLSLYGAWDRREKWLLRVALRDLPVTAVEEDGVPYALITACEAPSWKEKGGFITPPPQDVFPGPAYELTLIPAAGTDGRIAAFPCVRER